jgi:uncharacterized Zn finger protein
MSPAGEKTWNLWDESPPPIPVEDGLIATGRTDRTSSGLGGSVVRRVLDRASPGISNRGRAYARAGQTVSVDFEEGRIFGEVQGSDPLPYQVEITCDVPETDQRRFVRALHHTLPEPVTEIPETFTRDLRRELAEYRILVDAALTVRCNCSYRGVCKHLVAFGYVAGEQLDQSPANIGALLGITDADLAGPEVDAEAADDEEPELAVFDRKRQAQLARTLASIDKREPLTRDDVLARAAEVLHPSATVANALDLDLYLDPVDGEGDDSEE